MRRRIAGETMANARYEDRELGTVFPDASTMVQSYLDRFAKRVGRQTPVLDAQGEASMPRGSARVQIQVLEDHGVLLLTAAVLPIPKANREVLYRRLLELSFLATADAAFAIDAKTDEVYVRALRRLSSLDYEEFADLLATVAKVADEWDDKLRAEFPG